MERIPKRKLAILMKNYIAAWIHTLPYQLALLELPLQPTADDYDNDRKSYWNAPRIRADVLRFDIRTHQSTVYEIKTSVEDFKSDKKMFKYLKYAEKLVIVVCDDVYAKIEVPKEYGIIVLSDLEYEEDKSWQPLRNFEQRGKKHEPEFQHIMLRRVLNGCIHRVPNYLEELKKMTKVKHVFI